MTRSSVLPTAIRYEVDGPCHCLELSCTTITISTCIGDSRLDEQNIRCSVPEDSTCVHARLASPDQAPIFTIQARSVY